MLAVDMSNYTSPLSPGALEGLKSAGVGHVIIQAIDPPAGFPAGRTRDQIQACLDAGLRVDAYIWLWFDLGVSDIQHKLSLLDGLPVNQLWLDVEDTAAVKYDQATTEAKITAALEACDNYPTASGQRTGVYSGRWYWTDRRYAGNTTSFSDRELWDANYDDVADATLGYVTYGGWERVSIKQYRGTSTLAGVSGLDLNVLSVEKEALDFPPPPPDPQPEPEPDTGSNDGSGTGSGDGSNTGSGDGSDTGSGDGSDGGVTRETPDDWPWPTWREAAINYRSIADDLGQQLAAVKPGAPTLA